jgi:hypothetical protein
MDGHDIVVFSLMIISLMAGSLMAELNIRGGIIIIMVAVVLFGLHKAEDEICERNEFRRRMQKNRRRR